MRTISFGLLAMMLLLAPVARGDIQTIVNNTGFPNTAELTQGAAPYYTMHITSASSPDWDANGIRITLHEPMLISRIAGVMAHLQLAGPWAQSTQHINVFSSKDEFAKNPLQGDVYHITQGVSIANLEPIDGFMVPPPITDSLGQGSTNYFSWVNRWVEFAFEPFELPAGTYIISVQIRINSNWLVSWSGLMTPNSHPPDIWTSSFFPRKDGNGFLVYERNTLNGDISGNAAAIIQGFLVNPPQPCRPDQLAIVRDCTFLGDAYLDDFNFKTLR